MRKTSVIAASLLAVAMTAGASHAAGPAYKVVGHVPGPDGGWDYASFDPDTRQVYLAKGDHIISAAVDTGAAATALPGSVSRSHQALPVGGGVLLVTNGGSNTAQFIDAKTGAEVASVPTGRGPDAAILDAKSGAIFVMDHGGGDVVFIDLKTRKATGTVMVGGALEYAAYDGAGRLYVNVEDKNEIAVVDVKAKTVVGRYALADCDGPTGLAYAPGAGLLIAACDGTAAILRASTGERVATLKIGKGPDAVIFDVGRKLAFIPSGGDGTLAVIDVADAKHVTVVQTVTTLRGARTGTVDPKTGKIYLPAAKYGPPASPGGRGSILPGSFEFLVVGP